jgi:hypothetical protein
MGPRRTLTSMEFLGPEGVRIALDGDGWRILIPRTLGQAILERARLLRDRCAECHPPVDPDRLEPVSLEEIGLHTAKTMGLRITHRYFKQRR